MEKKKPFDGAPPRPAGGDGDERREGKERKGKRGAVMGNCNFLK